MRLTAIRNSTNTMTTWAKAFETQRGVCIKEVWENQLPLIEAQPRERGWKPPNKTPFFIKLSISACAYIQTRIANARPRLRIRVVARIFNFEHTTLTVKVTVALRSLCSRTTTTKNNIVPQQPNSWNATPRGSTTQEPTKKKKYNSCNENTNNNNYSK